MSVLNLKRKHEGLANYLQPIGAPGGVSVTGLQPRQPVAENIAGDAQVLLKVHEPAGAEHGFFHHQKGPPVAHVIERAGHRAVGVGKSFTDHTGSVPNTVARRNRYGYGFETQPNCLLSYPCLECPNER